MGNKSYIGCLTDFGYERHPARFNSPNELKKFVLFLQTKKTTDPDRYNLFAEFFMIRCQQTNEVNPITYFYSNPEFDKLCNESKEEFD